MFLVVFKATRALHAADKSLLSVPCICGAERRQVFDQQATVFLPAVLGFGDHAHRLILLLVMDVAHLQVSKLGLPPLRCELGRDDLWPLRHRCTVAVRPHQQIVAVRHHLAAGRLLNHIDVFAV